MPIRLIIATLVLVFFGACTAKPPENGVLAQGTNQSFSHEITTTASPDAVWTLWTDVSTWSRWDKGLKEARAEAPLTIGVKGTIVPLQGSEASFVVTAFNPKTSYAFTTQLPFAELSVTRTITGEAPTRFRHDVRFDGPLAAVWASQFGPQFRAALPPTMEAIAETAEKPEP
jgi:hypothetical protein